MNDSLEQERLEQAVTRQLDGRATPADKWLLLRWVAWFVRLIRRR